MNAKIYRQNIMNASIIFKNRILPPAKRAAWWIDHVIKYGGKHLHPTVADLPYYQFLLIDVIAGLMMVFFVVCVTCYIILKYICRLFCKTKPKTD